MPRNYLTKDEMRVQVLKLKNELDKEWMNKTEYDPKWLAHHYLNKVLDKIGEYRA
jgi:hypothetical protein